jgi:hypothetical protein
MASYVLCNTVETFDAVPRTLSEAATILLDFEGVYLGHCKNPACMSLPTMRVM